MNVVDEGQSCINNYFIELFQTRKNIMNIFRLKLEDMNRLKAKLKEMRAVTQDHVIQLFELRHSVVEVSFPAVKFLYRC